MKKIFGKNQFMITTLAIMIAIAGYLHFTGDKSALEATNNTNKEATEGTVDLTKEEDSLENSISLSDLEELTDIDSMDSEDLGLADGEYEDTMEMVDSSAVAAGIEGENQTIDQSVVDNSVANSSDVEDGEVPGEAVFTSTTSVNTLAGAKLLKEQTRAKNKETLLEIINNNNISEEQKQSAIDSMVKMTELADKETAAEILLDAKGFEDVVVSISGDMADVVVSVAELTDTMRAQIEDIVQRKTGILAENIIISSTLK